MLTRFMKMLRSERAVHTAYCPRCGRWVLLDAVWGCRYCRTEMR